MNQLESALKQYVREHREEILEDILALVRCQSPSHRKDAVDRCADALIALVKQRTGLDPAEVLDNPETGKNLVFIYGSPDCTEQVTIIGHFDTVWELDSLPLREENGKIYGPGIYDMKTGVVASVWAIKAFQDLDIPLDKRIVLFFNSDEEIGSHVSRPLYLPYAKNSKAVVITEPSDAGSGKLKIARKGCGVFDIAIHGKASHAGNNHQGGISAIDEMARQILDIHALTDYDLGTTLNVGVADGGTCFNVVAAEAKMRVDLRVTSVSEGERIVGILKNLKPYHEGASITVTHPGMRPPLEFTEGGKKLFELACQCAEDLGLEKLEGAHVGGGSDGNYTSAAGIPTIDGMGAVGGGAHAQDEHIDVERTMNRIPLLFDFLARV